jgi:hypothetical protein
MTLRDRERGGSDETELARDANSECGDFVGEVFAVTFHGEPERRTAGHRRVRKRRTVVIARDRVIAANFAEANREIFAAGFDESHARNHRCIDDLDSPERISRCQPKAVTAETFCTLDRHTLRGERLTRVHRGKQRICHRRQHSEPGSRHLRCAHDIGTCATPRAELHAAESHGAAPHADAADRIAEAQLLLAAATEAFGVARLEPSQRGCRHARIK